MTNFLNLENIGKTGWIGLALKLGGATIVTAIAAVFLSFFLTVTHEDAVYRLDRIDASGLSNPEPGALYAIDDRQISVSRLCEYEVGSQDIIEAPPSYYEFYNQAGKLLPAIAHLNPVTGNDQPGKPKKATGPLTSVEWYASELAFTGSGRPVNENCAGFVSHALRAGKKVCPINSVMKNAEDGAAYAVTFHDLCIIPCPDDGTGSCRPVTYPTPNNIAWTTRMKRLLGLIALRIGAPMPT